MPIFEAEKILDNGLDTENIVMVIMDDGFTANEQKLFTDSAKAVVNSLLTNRDCHPFTLFKYKINVYEISYLK
jgi:hypothetical protein